MASVFRKFTKSFSRNCSTSKSNSSDSQRPPTGDIAQAPRLSAGVTSSDSSMHSIPLPRSFSSRSSKKICSICLARLRAGQGAIFTAECSHAFHFNCISTSVHHGNRLCPICRCQWKDVPFKAPTKPQSHHNIMSHARVSPEDVPQSTECPEQRVRFSDDEPLPIISADCLPNPPPPPSGGLTVKSFTEYPAVSASESSPRFGVLFSIHAPPLHDNARHPSRAPIDLVTVLDVSGSMGGSKIALVKRALRFVIHNLSSSDRLSIVTFSSSAQRIFPLRRMSDSGRSDANIAINALSTNGGTNIVEGLKTGVRVLEERHVKNPVSSVILLSDGRETQNYDQYRYAAPQTQVSSDTRQVQEFLKLLPPSICPMNNESVASTIPVHTFGFGSDHDSTVMHAISDSSAGMFSFIESIGKVQDAFAMCIGGLLSVVAQDFQLQVRSLSSGVKIEAIQSGRHKSEISNLGLQGIVNVESLYADEEKEFLIYLSIPLSPKGKAGQRRPEITPLLDACCSYKDSVTMKTVQVEKEIVVITRPRVLPRDMRVCLEVDRQRNRLLVTQGIAEAQVMAERGDLEGAQGVLAERRACLLSSVSGKAGDALCSLLESEIQQVMERMTSKELYERAGRAYVLSGLSSHSWQRATTRGEDSGGLTGGIAYETPSMVHMVARSQMLPTRPSSLSCPLRPR